MMYVIKEPLVTEKNSMMAEKGVYVFKVDTKSDKTQIKSAVEKFFGVKVKSVRTVLCRKRKKATRVSRGTIHYWKKAMVQLAPGEKISLFEGA
jgi:large subunit ribosomal protein L23